MPFAPTPAIGLIALTTVKFVGYSLFGVYLNKLYKPNKPKAFSFGLVRTVVGLLVGALAASICLQMLSIPLTIFLILLIPIRFGEWLLVIWLFFGKSRIIKLNKVYRQLIIGVVWSFILDIPVIASLFIIPGGLWVC